MMHASVESEQQMDSVQNMCITFTFTDKLMNLRVY